MHDLTSRRLTDRYMRMIMNDELQKEDMRMINAPCAPEGGVLQFAMNQGLLRGAIVTGYTYTCLYMIRTAAQLTRSLAARLRATG